jgi:hypothetical protein
LKVEKVLGFDLDGFLVEKELEMVFLMRNMRNDYAIVVFWLD